MCGSKILGGCNRPKSKLVSGKTGFSAQKPIFLRKIYCENALKRKKAYFMRKILKNPCLDTNFP